MTAKQREFLEKLNQLMHQYDAALLYTIDDDGIHIEVEREECFVGWLDYGIMNDLPKALKQ